MGDNDTMLLCHSIVALISKYLSPESTVKNNSLSTFKNPNGKLKNIFFYENKKRPVVKG